MSDAVEDDPSDGPESEAFVAEFTLSSPEIEALAELVPDVELRMVDEYRDADGKDHAIFWVIAEDFDRFERGLTGSGIIESWASLVVVSGRRLYDIVVAKEGELVGAIELSRRHRIVWQVMSAHHGHLFIRAIIPNPSSIREYREAVVEQGYDFSLERVMRDVTSELDDGGSITPRQREAIVLAYEFGYYRQPREVTLETIGEELGISESAVSGRLNRGLERLIEHCLGLDGPPGSTSESS